MKLSAYVPSVLRQGIKSLVGNLVDEIDIAAPNEIGHYAIHPGGKKILDVVAEELGIGKDMLEASYQTLRDFGNMSSPTILFVLKKIILAEKQSTEKDKMILGMAFGPGITIESMLLKLP
jgi:alpha-pyrone synthase